MTQYIFLNPQINIIHNIDGITIWQSNPVGRDNVYNINNFGAEIIKYCSGIFTIDEIVTDLSNRYKTVNYDLHSAIVNFINECASLEIIQFSDKKQNHTYNLSGNSRTITPIHYLLELTSSCNLKCEYCYWDECNQDREMNHNILSTILFKLAKNGVQTIELTGGEPSLHPNFVEIVKECVQLFSFVAIISNGTLLWKFVKSLLDCPREKLLFQLDLDGPNSTIHDSISGVNGSFDNVIQSINALRKEHFHVKAVMNVYKKNLTHMEETLNLARSINVDNFSCTPVIKIGRARNIDVLDEEDYLTFFKNIESFGKRFPTIYQEAVEGVPTPKSIIPHCGAGWKSLTIDPDGDVRVCPMSTNTVHKIGNISNKDYSDFLLENMNIMRRFKSIVVPNLETCNGCSYSNFCLGCFVRPYYVITQNKENHDFHCNWNNRFSIY